MAVGAEALHLQLLQIYTPNLVVQLGFYIIGAISFLRSLPPPTFRGSASMLSAGRIHHLSRA